MTTYQFNDRWGDTMDACLVRGEYNNGSLAVEMITNSDGYWEPWATVTVNLGRAMGRFAFLDTNNFPEGPKFLEDNGLAVPTGDMAASGYCTYPLYEFTDKFFAECEEYGEE